MTRPTPREDPKHRGQACQGQDGSRFENRSSNPRREHNEFHLHFWTEDVPRYRYRRSTGPIHLTSGNIGLAKKIDSVIRQMAGGLRLCYDSMQASLHTVQCFRFLNQSFFEKLMVYQ